MKNLLLAIFIFCFSVTGGVSQDFINQGGAMRGYTPGCHGMPVTPAVNYPTNFYWRIWDQDNGFVNDHVTRIKGITFEGHYSVFAATRKNGIYQYHPECIGNVFKEWDRLVLPQNSGEEVASNDFIPDKEHGIIAGTPLGLFSMKKGMFLENNPPLISRNILGLFRYRDKVILVTEKGANSRDCVNVWFIEPTEHVISWDRAGKYLYIACPTRYYIFDLDDPSHCETHQLPWSNCLLAIKEGCLFGGINGVFVHLEGENNQWISPDGMKKTWISALGGLFSPKIGEKIRSYSPGEDGIHLEMATYSRLQEKYQKLAAEYDRVRSTQSGGHSGSSSKQVYQQLLETGREIDVSQRKTNTILQNRADKSFWIGTQNDGIHVFDPINRQWVRYHEENSPLKTNRISCLYQTPNAMWIGTVDGGIVRYGSFLLPRGKNGEVLKLLDGRFRMIKRFGMSLYAIEESKGILQYDCLARNENYLEIPVTKDDNSRLTTLDIDQFGNMWIGTDNKGLVYRKPDGWVHFTMEAGLPGLYVETVKWLKHSKTVMISCKLDSGKISVKTAIYNQGRFDRYDEETFLATLDKKSKLYREIKENRIVYDDLSIPGISVTDILQTENLIYFATSSGLFSFDGSLWRSEASIPSVELKQLSNSAFQTILAFSEQEIYEKSQGGTKKFYLPSFPRVIQHVLRDEFNDNIFWFSQKEGENHTKIMGIDLMSGFYTDMIVPLGFDEFIIIYPFIYMINPAGKLNPPGIYIMRFMF